MSTLKVYACKYRTNVLKFSNKEGVMLHMQNVYAHTRTKHGVGKAVTLHRKSRGKLVRTSTKTVGRLCGRYYIGVDRGIIDLKYALKIRKFVHPVQKEEL